MSSLVENNEDLISPVDGEVKSHDITHRKKIGAFYTPLTVSTALSLWGIRSKKDLILEPCFGGCTFLEAAIARLTSLGNSAPESNLFGCDIDPLAFSYLKTRINPSNIDGHFFLQDFIEHTPKQNSKGKVDLVIGNPPYIRQSNFSPKQRELLGASMKKIGVNIHGRASLWAYFVLHALQFIKEDGRLALVLPGSFLYADYSVAVREYLRLNFESVTALTLAERLFISEGTEETTVILLGEGFGKPPKYDDVRIKCIESVDDLAIFMDGWSAESSLQDEAYPGHGLVPAEVGMLHSRLATLPDMVKLGEIATMRIGLVTGNTPYFVKSPSDWRQLKIERRYLRYILPRSQYVSGLALRSEDCEDHIKKDIRCLALWTPTAPRQERLVEYLDSYPIAERKKNATLRRRPVWHQFDDSNGVSDAFFVFMADQGPRVMLNRVGAIATNSVYRVFFNKGVTASQMKLVALSMYTTFTQLAAEIIGHPRGSGALKLEPSSALRLTLHLPKDRTPAEISAVFNLVDESLRRADAEGARQIADNFLFRSGELVQSLPALRAGLKTIRNRRIP